MAKKPEICHKEMKKEDRNFDNDNVTGPRNRGEGRGRKLRLSVESLVFICRMCLPMC